MAAGGRGLVSEGASPGLVSRGVGRWEGTTLASESVGACLVSSGVSPRGAFLRGSTASARVSTEAGVGARLVRVGAAEAILRLVESAGAGGRGSDSSCSPVACASTSVATGPVKGFLIGRGLIFRLATGAGSGSFVFALTGSCATCGSFVALPFLTGTSSVFDPPFFAFPFDAVFAAPPFVLTGFSSLSSLLPASLPLLDACVLALALRGLSGMSSLSVADGVSDATVLEGA